MKKILVLIAVSSAFQIVSAPAFAMFADKVQEASKAQVASEALTSLDAYSADRRVLLLAASQPALSALSGQGLSLPLVARLKQDHPELATLSNKELTESAERILGSDASLKAEHDFLLGNDEITPQDISNLSTYGLIQIYSLSGDKVVKSHAEAELRCRSGKSLAEPVVHLDGAVPSDVMRPSLWSFELRCSVM